MASMWSSSSRPSSRTEKSAIETVTPMLGKNNNLRMSGYSTLGSRCFPAQQPAPRRDRLGAAVEVDADRRRIEILDHPAAVAEQVEGHAGGRAESVAQGPARRPPARRPNRPGAFPAVTLGSPSTGKMRTWPPTASPGPQAALPGRRSRRPARTEAMKAVSVGQAGVLQGVDPEEGRFGIGGKLVAGDQRQSQHAHEVEHPLLVLGVAVGRLISGRPTISRRRTSVDTANNSGMFCRSVWTFFGPVPLQRAVAEQERFAGRRAPSAGPVPSRSRSCRTDRTSRRRTSRRRSRPASA